MSLVNFLLESLTMISLHITREYCISIGLVWIPAMLWLYEVEDLSFNTVKESWNLIDFSFGQVR